MTNIKKGDLIRISHKFGKLGYEVLGVVVTPPVGNAHSLPYVEVFNKKEKRVYLKNILAITLVNDGQKANSK